MPSCRLLESIIQDSVYKGDNHHEDPMILLTLTSSRIDSIRTWQYLVDYKFLQLANILGSRSFSALGHIKADPITLCQ
jgi:hypothetical protein